jgi:hypothetical protein
MQRERISCDHTRASYLTNPENARNVKISPKRPRENSLSFLTKQFRLTYQQHAELNNTPMIVRKNPDRKTFDALGDCPCKNDTFPRDFPAVSLCYVLRATRSFPADS